MLSAARGAALAVALALCPVVGAAQVGHPPERSPFHEIARGNAITIFGGRFEGNGGRVGVGPNSAFTYGIRWDFRAGNPLSFGGGVQRGTFQRLIVDPRLATPVTGPVDQAVTFAELSVQLNLTGSKTWNRLAPFVGVAGGIAFGERTAADTSGYNFGTKGYFAPNAGVRIFLTERLHVRGEVRANFWKLSYPPIFREGTNPVTLDQSEWNLSPWFVFGLGYTL